jgi:hypothetical protein
MHAPHSTAAHSNHRIFMFHSAGGADHCNRNINDNSHEYIHIHADNPLPIQRPLLSRGSPPSPTDLNSKIFQQVSIR